MIYQIIIIRISIMEKFAAFNPVLDVPYKSEEIYTIEYNKSFHYISKKKIVSEGEHFIIFL